MTRPRLLDTFCKAGGAGMGYHRAGFEVVGVDIEPQKRYPFEFHQGDALEFIREHGHEFDVIHASPPCQAFSAISVLWQDRNHPDLVGVTRQALEATGRPYIIENVPGAPLVNWLMLCGTMFGLYVIRHRRFETCPTLAFSPATCNHDLPVVRCGHRPERWKQFASVVGHHSDTEYSGMAMGIDWMTRDELAQAIPPAYTEWLGRRILEAL